MEIGVRETSKDMNMYLFMLLSNMHFCKSKPSKAYDVTVDVFSKKCSVLDIIKAFLCPLTPTHCSTDDSIKQLAL